jgi:hypothetical protein
MSKRDDFRSLNGTRWRGSAELWLDPLANDAQVSECTLRIDDRSFSYEWSHAGKPQRGSYQLHDTGADWQDTWHSPGKMTCKATGAGRGLLDVAGTYAAPPGPAWGWRSVLSLRPTGELVLQMTNVAPWGEEQRAVRMIFQREER